LFILVIIFIKRKLIKKKIISKKIRIMINNKKTKRKKLKNINKKLKSLRKLKIIREDRHC